MRAEVVAVTPGQGAKMRCRLRSVVEAMVEFQFEQTWIHAFAGMTRFVALDNPPRLGYPSAKFET